MRWHVGLNETGTPLRVEHVDDEEVALRTAQELAADARGGHSRASEQEVERVVGRLADEGLEEVEPGIERPYQLSDRVSVIVAGLDEGDVDSDCWKCRGREAS